jgi:hypothetical protein
VYYTTILGMTPTRKVTTFRLDDELLGALRMIWDRDGIQPSEQVRRAIRMWAESKGVKVDVDRKRAVSQKTLGAKKR